MLWIARERDFLHFFFVLIRVWSINIRAGFDPCIIYVSSLFNYFIASLARNLHESGFQ
jgi:hypothetical protein